MSLVKNNKVIEFLENKITSIFILDQQKKLESKMKSKKKQISICEKCVHCVSYTNPEIENKDQMFEVRGYNHSTSFFNEPGALCSITKYLVPFNVLECEKFKLKK